MWSPGPQYFGFSYAVSRFLASSSHATKLIARIDANRPKRNTDHTSVFLFGLFQKKAHLTGKEKP